MRRSFERGRKVLSVTFVLFLWAVIPPGHANADFQVGWDCYLPDAGIECQDLRGAYLSSIPGVSQAERADASLSITMRSVRMSSGHRYVADFEGQPANAPEGSAAFTLLEEVPDAAGDDRTLLVLVAMLQRGSVPYLHVPTPGVVEAGVLRIEVGAGDSESGTAESEDDANSGWYLRPELSGELVSAGVRVISLQGGFELGYSHPRWRLLSDADGGYRHLDLALPGGRLRGGFVQGKGNVTLAHSLGSGFSAAVLGGAYREPQNNLDGRMRGGVGLEWVHRERLKVDEGNLGVRYRMFATWDDYATTTVHGDDARLYPRQILGVFARWHLDDVDLEADVQGGVVADQMELWDVGAELSTTFRLAEGLELALSGSVLYRGGAVHQPADPSSLDPVASIVSGSDFGELTFTSGIALSYTMGNGLLRAQDQRWR